MSKILVIGSGGREHAIGWKLSQSQEVSEIIYAPGNAGTANEPKSRNIPINGTQRENFPALLKLVKDSGIEMVIVGPETALDNGIVDYFYMNDFQMIFGPTQRACLLESDKFFSYDLMEELKIPQAISYKCSSLYDGLAAIDMMKGISKGVVLKARGLTGGKGVEVFDSRKQGRASLENFIKKYGNEFLVAEKLSGPEFSVFGISDGNLVLPFEIAVQDHKRLLDNDKGPNTGGMGAYCPVPIAGREIVMSVSDNIMTPVVKRMKEKGIPYVGFLYAGMMMTEQGPKVIEFNARLGDPEAQPLMMMLKSNLHQTLLLGLEGRLKEVSLEFNPGAACTVILPSQGYPDASKIKKGLPITGLAEAGRLKDVKIFHAATKYEGDRIVNDGGRVLCPTAYSQIGLRQARDLAYQVASQIHIEGEFPYRRDIASKALGKV